MFWATQGIQVLHYFFFLLCFCLQKGNTWLFTCRVLKYFHRLANQLCLLFGTGLNIMAFAARKKNIDWWNWTRSLKLWDLNRLAERLQSCIILCGFVTLCKLFWLNFTAICSKYHEATGVRHAWCITESIHSLMLSAVQWSLIRLTLLSEILCSFSRQRLPCERRIVSCALFLSRREKRGDGRVRSCWKVRGQGWVYRWESSCAQGLTGSVGCTVPPITHAAWGLCHLCN